MPDNVSLSHVLNALDRAARYRRSLATGTGVNPVTLVNDIIGIPAPSPIRVDPDGWASVGTVSDGFAGAVLAVRWHVETDRVRVERPPVSVSPASLARPLYAAHSPMGGAHSSPTPFIALSGFVFTFEGIDYDRVAAERLTAERGSLDGWTWRPAP